MWTRIPLNTDTTTERSRQWHRTTEHSNVLCARTTPALFFASSAEAVLSAFTILGAHWAHEWRRSARWATGRFDKRPAAAEPLVGLMQLSAELCQSRSRHTSHLRPTQPLPPPRGGGVHSIPPGGTHWAHRWRRSARWAAAEPLVGLMQLSAELCHATPP